LKAINPRIHQRKSRIKATMKYLVVLVVVLLVAIFQDFLHASYESHSFYFSESLLFNLFWLLFLPVTLLVRLFSKKLEPLAVVRSKWKLRGIFVGIASICHLLLFSFLVYALSELFYGHTYRFADNLSYSLHHDLYKCLLIYTAISLLPPITQPNSHKEESNSFSEFLLILVGKRKEKVLTQSILFISSSTPYVEIWTSQKRYLQQESLKSIAKKLDPNSFVRIHKTCLVNVEQVSSIQSRGNGDYDLLLKNGKELRMSRNYAQEFKRLFLQGSTG
jgi:two-component system LytT family response regulator